MKRVGGGSESSKTLLRLFYQQKIKILNLLAGNRKVPIYHISLLSMNLTSTSVRYHFQFLGHCLGYL